jgi:tetrahydromethanopterin S-methyltransferase subunit D
VDTNSFPGFVARWAGVVLVFDIAASLTSLGTGLPYAWFTIGSVVIYLAVGYMGAPRFGVRSAAGATVLVALVEATLGWAVTWFIGPGQLPDPDASISVFLISGAIGALIFGGIMGLLGGWFAVRRQRSNGN